MFEGRCAPLPQSHIIRLMQHLSHHSHSHSHPHRPNEHGTLQKLHVPFAHTTHSSPFSARMVTFVLPPSTHDGTSPHRDGDTADIIIKCGGQTFSAHKATVCRQSQRLQDACDTIAKVSGLHTQLISRKLRLKLIGANCRTPQL